MSVITTLDRRIVTALPPTNARFAAVVKRLVGDLSTRDVYRLTGVSHSRVSDMLFGIVPGYRLLVRFADGLKLSPADRRELFEAAGYAAAEEESRGMGAQHLYEGLRRLNAKHGRALPVELSRHSENLTIEEADEILRQVDQDAQEGLI